MTFQPVCLLILFTIAICAATIENANIKVDRARGIPLSKRALYDASKDFVCLDGSRTIKFAAVNDDYCDCADGSDEPGTAACPKATFHCVNLGHQPMNIPSSRVNDQICDCCDGSDEWVGLVSCDNTCNELGREAREAAERRLVAIREGFEKRKELVRLGKKMVDEKKTRLAEVNKEKEALEPQREELKAQKEAAETAEREMKDAHNALWEQQKETSRKEQATDIFHSLDTDGDKKLTHSDLKHLLEFDKDSDGTVTNEEITALLAGHESADIEHFSTTESSEADPEVEETEGDQDEEDEDSPHQDNVEVFDKERPSVTYAEELVPMPDYTDEQKLITKAAEDTRNAFNEFDVKFNELDSEAKSLSEFLELDLGVDSEWASLREQCIAFHDNQYTYNLCLFNKASQLPKSGGFETSIGKWSGWTGDEPDHKYNRQMYKGGASCWNGPERSLDVVIVCGSETRLLGASEPAKCEYRVEMETPAVCPDPATHTDEAHIEL